jgi:hypothetical protein
MMDKQKFLYIITHRRQKHSDFNHKIFHTLQVELRKRDGENNKDYLAFYPDILFGMLYIYVITPSQLHTLY